MSMLSNFLIAFMLLSVQFTTPIAANDALQRIPENALGFAVVRNLTQASAKFEQLLQPLDITFPAPLAFVKLVTGLDEGLDLSGNLVIAFLPAAAPKAETELMVLLPVTDYAAFATSINAESNGEISQVTLLGEDILVAQDGSYAMLMNVEHLQTMEELVALEAEPIATLTPLTTWLTKQDVALVLMPSGVELASNWKRQATHRFGIGYEFVQSRSMLSELLSGVLASETRAWFRSNIELAAIGVAVDDKSNVRLNEQLVLKTNSPFANMVPQTSERPAARLGLSKQPFVFTAGGSLASGWGKQLAALLRQSEQAQAAQNGLENISPELWDREEAAFRLLLEEIGSCSVVMLQGEKGEPLLGNFLGVATVPDVSKYLESLPQIVATWNELTQLSTSEIKLDVELTPLTISEKTGLEFVVDVASKAQDPNVPALNWLLESVLGPAGKLRVQLVPVDQTTFIFCLATREQLTELLRVVPQDISRRPQSPDSQATLELLQPESQWKILIDPQGCLYWASRVANEFVATLTNQEVKIPALPDTPPVGMAVHFVDRRWKCELICPAETWKKLSRYVAAYRNQ